MEMEHNTHIGAQRVRTGTRGLASDIYLTRHLKLTIKHVAGSSKSEKWIRSLSVYGV